MNSVNNNFENMIFQITGKDLMKLSEILIQENQKMMKDFIAEMRGDIISSKASEWITEAEAMNILHYKSKKKYQQLRDEGKVKFTKIGRKILYSRESINDLIDKNIIFKF